MASPAAGADTVLKWVGNLLDAEIRLRVAEAQGYVSRPRTGTPAEVLATIRRVGCIQLDSVSTVERSHRVALGARVGAYPEPCISRLLRTGKLFEYWAHEACLLPVEDYPMHGWRMAKFAESHPWRGNVFEREPELTQQVLREIRERGPLGSRHFEGSGPRAEGSEISATGMWNWKPAKRMLDALWTAGDLVIADWTGGPSPAPPSWRNLLGTDDQARDVLARVIYGLRLSILFGFALTALSSAVGIAAGAIQGYRGGLTDLLFQRFIEIWNGMPQLFLLIILGGIITPGFWVLLAFLLLFSWMNLTGVVRAEFLRGRTLEFVRAARALEPLNVSFPAVRILFPVFSRCRFISVARSSWCSHRVVAIPLFASKRASVVPHAPLPITPIAAMHILSYVRCVFLLPILT